MTVIVNVKKWLAVFIIQCHWVKANSDFWLPCKSEFIRRYRYQNNFAT